MTERQIVNINCEVRVRLTDRGRQAHRAHHEETISRALIAELDADTGLNPGQPWKYQPPLEDGWIEMPLWKLMHVFGPSIWSSGQLFQHNTIELDAPEDPS